MKDLRLSMAQMRSVAGDMEGNLSRILDICRLASSEETDILCLPELCLSGYAMPYSSEIPIPDGHPAIQSIEDVSAETGMCICFGYVGEGPCIRQAVVEDGRMLGRYDKTHLGEREQVMRPGENIDIIRTSGAVIGIQLCWESHFPEISTTLALEGADIILMPFASGLGGDRRRSSWLRYLPARAYDNTVYVGACNAYGPNGFGTEFGGGAMIFDPRGETMCEDFGGTGIVTADLSAEPLERIRRKGYESMKDLCFLDKRRPELYKK